MNPETVNCAQAIATDPIVKNHTINKKVINALSNWQTCHQIEMIACSVLARLAQWLRMTVSRTIREMFSCSELRERSATETNVVCVFRCFYLMGIYLVAYDLFIAVVQVRQTHTQKK